ncbi:hypothetical protein D3C87_856210 [compost metagenome]
MNHSIPNDIQKILIELEFIAQIQNDCKVNIAGRSVVPTDSWMGSIKRAIAQEGRNGTAIFVDNIVDDAIEAIDRYRHTIYVDAILSALERSIDGIRNLENTYKVDKYTVAKFRVCITKILHQLNEEQKFKCK